MTFFRVSLKILPSSVASFRVEQRSLPVSAPSCVSPLSQNSLCAEEVHPQPHLCPCLYVYTALIPMAVLPDVSWTWFRIHPLFFLVNIQEVDHTGMVDGTLLDR